MRPFRAYTSSLLNPGRCPRLGLGRPVGAKKQHRNASVESEIASCAFCAPVQQRLGLALPGPPELLHRRTECDGYQWRGYRNVTRLYFVIGVAAGAAGVVAVVDGTATGVAVGTTGVPAELVGVEGTTTGTAGATTGFVSSS
jgi:hypothetical protein